MTLVRLTRRSATIIEWTAACLLTAAVAYLHVRALQHLGPLWRDEISSLHLATAPTVHGFWSALVYDPFPALFFATLRFWHWCGLGETDAALRVLGCVIGLGICTAIWIVGWTVKKAPPLLALVLFGLSPVAVVWGDSLRPHGFSCLWNILAIAGFAKLLCPRPCLTDVIAATVAALLSVHSLFPNAVFLFAVVTGVMAVALRRGWWRPVVITAAIGLTALISLLFYVPIIRQALNWTALAKGNANLGSILERLFHAASGAGKVGVLLWAGSAIITVSAISVTLVRWPRIGWSETDKDVVLYAGITVVIATVGIIGFFLFIGWTTSIWYYVPVMAAAAVCFDAIAGMLRRGPRSIVIGAVIALVAAVFVWPAAYRATATRLTNVDVLSAEIAGIADKDDLIVVDRYFYAISFNRYYHGQARWLSAPDLPDVNLHRWDLLTEVMRHPQPIAPIIDQIQQTLRAGHNVFIVGYAQINWAAGPPADLPPAPRGSLGWTLWPYVGTWTRQIDYAAQEHAEHGVILPVDCHQPVSSGENLKVLVLAGWREQPRRLY